MSRQHGYHMREDDVSTFNTFHVQLSKPTRTRFHVGMSSMCLNISRIIRLQILLVTKV